MLTHDFCTVQNLVSLPGSINASLQWNAGHPVFLGHFPGQPVVPGVCMIQMVTELLASCLGTKIRLQESAQMKFLLFIDPRVNPVVDITISYTSAVDGIYKVNASLQKEQDLYFKFMGVFTSLKTNEGEI
jgi:3-hydroxyacyl-[acyl-carrier-protein] dehydratase